MGNRELREMVKQMVFMNVKQLKALAKENGYKGYSKLKKAELIDMAYNILIEPIEADLKGENIVEVEILEPNKDSYEPTIEHKEYDIEQKRLSEDDVIADIAKKVGCSVSGKGLAYAFNNMNYDPNEKDLLEMLNKATNSKIYSVNHELKKIDEFIEEYQNTEEVNKIFENHNLAYRLNFNMYVVKDELHYTKLLLNNNSVKEVHRNFEIICPALGIMPPDNKNYEWLHVNSKDTIEYLNENNLIVFIDEYTEEILEDIAQPIQYGFTSKYEGMKALDIVMEESKTRTWGCSMSDVIDLTGANDNIICLDIDELIAINNGELYYINMTQLLQYKEVCLENVELVKEVIDTNMKQLTTAINQKYLA